MHQAKAWFFEREFGIRRGAGANGECGMGAWIAGEWEMDYWLVCRTCSPLTPPGRQDGSTPGIPLAIHHLPFTLSLTRTDVNVEFIRTGRQHKRQFAWRTPIFSGEWCRLLNTEHCKPSPDPYPEFTLLKGADYKPLPLRYF